MKETQKMNLKERRTAMKGKGKWAVLLLALGVMFTGCFGPSGSSDESAVAAKDNPVIGTFEVTVPALGNNEFSIKPAVLGAASITPVFDVGGVFATDQVVTVAGAAVIPALPAGNQFQLPNGHVVPGSERVMVGAVKLVRGTDYSIQYYDPVNHAVNNAFITALGGALAAGGNITYGYGSGTCPAQGWDGSKFVACIDVYNTSRSTIEKLRGWTGAVSGPGSAGTPVVGTAPGVGASDYPPGPTYGDPNPTGIAPVEGWAAGVCYNSWGYWSSYTPGLAATEGCSYKNHTDDVTIGYASPWLDPVCGRSSNILAPGASYEQWNFAGTDQFYKFYLQLSGDMLPWENNYMLGLANPHAGADDVHYSTWYAVLARLTPDFTSPAPATYCNTKGPAVATLWWKGSMAPITPGQPTKHCGTLITDPYLRPNSYFALNIGVEFADEIEQMGQAFWTAYKANPVRTADQGIGALYPKQVNMALLYDQTKLQVWNYLAGSGLTKTLATGGTAFMGGFVSQNTPANINNMSLNHLYPTGKWNYPFTSKTTTAGFLSSNQSQSISNTVFAWFTYSISAAPYITQVTKCFPYVVAGNAEMPQWAGQFGVTHYDGACNLIVEPVDADIDYWMGMITFKVNAAATPGDYAYIRYDETASIKLLMFYNNRTADRQIAADDTTVVCGYKSTGLTLTCPPDMNSSDLFIWRGDELTDPALPPGHTKGYSARYPDCPLGAGSFTCGGRHWIGPVVCIQ